MPLTAEFLRAVAPVDKNWSMGVELVSPLLYSLIRCAKPRSALEVGAGYSSLFILQALADNAEEFERHRAEMRGHVRSDRHKGMRRLLKGRHPLPLHSPAFYETDHAPTLSVIDDVSHPATSAPQVESIAAALKLDHLLRFHKGDFRGMSQSMPPELLPFDFVWFDCGGYHEYADFLAEYWTHINPDGGLLALHSTLTNVLIRPILLDLKLKQATDHFNKFEMLSVLEPHKWRQNSVTLIRMLSPKTDRVHTLGP